MEVAIAGVRSESLRGFEPGEDAVAVAGWIGAVAADVARSGDNPELGVRGIRGGEFL